jgi:hypothetical protein
LRAPDVEIKDIGGIPHVVARLREGTRDDYNQKYQATHYSISPNFTMPKEAFMRLLDQLAANALSAQRRQGNG